ncbi:MAG: C-terminal binding protein [Actinomycetota bacterium]|nr:C-terminal binding protein [Actinomycetota bacterium]
MRGLILDSLVRDIDEELKAARVAGDCSLDRWSGSNDELANADFVLHVKTVIDAAMIDRLTRCRAIGRFGTGLDTVDAVAAAARGIVVVGVPDYATAEVAQHAVALALAVARGLGRLTTTHPKEAWSLLLGSAVDLTGPVGIVGFGAIGRRAAELFAGLGFEVIVSTRQVDFVEKAGLTACPIDELLERAQIVSLHTALVPETRKLINSERLRRMRPDAILVNTARGALVESMALIEALRHGRIFGAGLDVYEPGDVDWWELLRSSKLNVVLTPHVAWYAPSSIKRLRANAVNRTIDAARRAYAADQLT